MTTTPERNSMWLAEDSIAPVHHCSNDERRDFLVDRERGEVVSPRQADELAVERLERSELGEQIMEDAKQQGVTSSAGRRSVLRAAMGAGALMLASAAMPRMAYAAGGSPTKTLVVIFLRGGIDGLHVLAPWQDATYRAKRPTLALSPSADSTMLNSTFMLHPSMKSLRTAWENGHLSFANAVGDKSMERSHFDEQARVDRMAPVEVRTGWLARRQMATMAAQPTFRSYAANLQTPLSLAGDFPVFSSPNFGEYKIYDDGNATNLAVKRIYEAPGGTLPAQAAGLFTTLDQVKAWSRGYTPSPGVTYPNGGPSRQLQQVAQVIKAGVGLEVATIDVETFDDHGDEASALGGRLKELADALAAFYADLGDRMSDVTLITQSEFGRTTRENGYRGTDHGRGNMVLCLSGKAAPKTVAGAWPTLSDSATDRNGDLEVTVDHRDVAAEVLSKHFGDSSAAIAKVVPGHSPKPVGLLR